MDELEDEARRKSLSDLMDAMGEEDIKRVPAFASRSMPTTVQDQDPFSDVQDPRLAELLRRKKGGMSGLNAL